MILKLIQSLVNHIGALVTIVDRATKFTLIKKVDSKKADVVTQALIDILLSNKSNYSYNASLR